MSVQSQIDAYIESQPGLKRDDLLALHGAILDIMPGCRLWYLDGLNEDGKIVSNPNIGYGVRTVRYAGGKTKDFYQIGLSGNTTGISVYILGIDDKAYLPVTYGGTIGKASVTGYCIKFKTLADIDIATLAAAIRSGVSATSER
jgi:hypothetical protein